MDLKTALQEIIKGDVSSDTEVLEKHSRDASIFEIKPQLVIAPKEVEDIKHLVKFISENPSMHLSLTPRAAGTDMSGGAINESIVLSMTEHFNHIVQIGKDFAVTEPGVYYRDFEAETLKHNLFLPCYPSSRQLCTVGGMVGNNAAGEKTLSFGQTKDYVERLKAVLSDGNEYSLEPLSITELNKKLAQTDFEGAIYKKMYNLLEENFEKVQHARPRTSKNSTGYLLWDVWDRKTFDLTKIFVGSQGTLGVITKVMFRLVRPNTYSKLVVFFIYDLTNLGAIVNKVLAHKPESFELYDDQTLRYAGKYWPDIVDKIQPKSLMNLFLGFFPEAWMEVTHGLPKLVLMAEFTGESEQEVEQKCQSAKDDLKDYHLIMKITEDQDDAKRYWVIRRESFNLFRLHSGGGKRTAPFIDDLIIPPQYLPEFYQN